MKMTKVLISIITCLTILGCEDTIYQQADPRLFNDAFHGNIIGKVQQKSSGAIVRVSQIDVVAKTNISPIDGAFRIENIPIGNYDLEIEADNYRIYRHYNVKVEGAGTTYLGEIDLSRIPDIVESHYPENMGEIVYNNSFQRLTVSLLFTQPMDRESVEEAFSTDPPTEGIFYWGIFSESPTYIYFTDDRAVEYFSGGFIPDATISTYSRITSVSYRIAQKDSYVDTTYTVHLSTAAKDTAGNHLRFPLSFSFSTIQSSSTIYGIQTYPYNGDIDVELINNNGITLQFPRNMDPVSTEAAITLNPNVEHVFIWPDWNNLIIYTGGIFLAETEYRVSIDGSAKDTDGIELQKPFTFSFQTSPVKVTNTSPRNGQLFVEYNDLYITMYFNTYISKASVEKAFSISPAVGGSFKWGTRYSDNDKTVVSFYPSVNLARNTKYQVTLSTAVADLLGAHIKEPHQFAFITRPE